MKTLGIDSASPLGSIALTEGGRTLGQLSLMGRLTHAQNLLPEAESLLTRLGLGWGDVGALGVALGPGSFTGVRIGIATVLGLSKGLGIPAYGISTLLALALSQRGCRWPVCPLMDLRRGQLYGALYDVSGHVPQVRLPEGHYAVGILLDALPPEVMALGRGALAIEPQLRARLGEGLHTPPLMDVGGLGPIIAAEAGARALKGDAPGEGALTPVYLQASAAEQGRTGASAGARS